MGKPFYFKRHTCILYIMWIFFFLLYLLIIKHYHDKIGKIPLKGIKADLLIGYTQNG